MVLLEGRRLKHRNYINIWPLKELRGIEATDTHLTLGALTTYTDVQANPILRREFPMLCQHPHSKQGTNKKPRAPDQKSMGEPLPVNAADRKGG